MKKTILLFISVNIFISCGAPLYVFSSNKSDTYNTSETNTNKIYKSALRTAGDIGLKVTSSDIAGGTFSADKQGLMNIVRFNFILLESSAKSGSSFSLNTRASFGGRNINKKFKNKLHTYFPINSDVTLEKSTNNTSVKESKKNVERSSQSSEKTSAVFAQGALPKEGDLFVGGKFAVGAIAGASFGLAASAEKILQEDFLNLGDIPGALGAGVTLGYISWGDKYSGITNTSITDFRILGRAYYHADVLKNEKIDTYVTLGLGLRIWRVNYPEPPADYGIFSDFWPKDITEINLITESSLGIRYFLSKSLSVAAELGYGIGALRVGVDLTL